MKSRIPQPVPIPSSLDRALVETLKQRGVSFDGLRQALKELWPKLAADQGQRTKGALHYAEVDQLVSAYMAYYLPANVMKIPLVLSEARYFGVRLPPSWRWLDLGSGPGTAVMGAMLWRGQFADDSSNSKDYYYSLDRSKKFLDIQRQLFSRYLSQESSKCNGKRPRSQPPEFEFGNMDYYALGETLRRWRPTVVSFANTLVEAQGEQAQQARAELVQSLAQEMLVLSEKDHVARYMIMVEPGSKSSSRSLLSLKDSVFTKNNLGHLLLPCLSHRPCGALVRADDWCHEAVECDFPQWHQDLGAAAGLNKEQLLFSYLLWSTHPPDAGAAGAWPHHGARVVSQRMEEKGLTKCYICTENGKKTVRVRHSKVTDRNQAFLSLERGAVLTAIDANEKGDVTAFEQLEWSRQ